MLYCTCTESLYFYLQVEGTSWLICWSAHDMDVSILNLLLPPKIFTSDILEHTYRQNIFYIINSSLYVFNLRLSPIKNFSGVFSCQKNPVELIYSVLTSLYQQWPHMIIIIFYLTFILLLYLINVPLSSTAINS